MKLFIGMLSLWFAVTVACSQTNPLCRMTFNGCAFHGWETSACSFVVTGKLIPGRYDGDWWRSVHLREQISFLNGFRDCYVFEYHGPMQYSLVAPFEWQREISAWYARTPDELGIPAPEFMLRTRALPDQKHIASREDALGEHGGYDARFWKTAYALGGTNEQHGFIAGYLWCHANVAKNKGGTFSRSPEEYAALISHWYHDPSAAAPGEDRETEKIANVLFKFRDAEPRAAAAYPGIDALLAIHGNFISAANIVSPATDEVVAEQETWKSNGFPNFRMSPPSPNSLTLPPGGAVSAIFQVTNFNTLNGGVSLSATGLPAGVTASFTRLDPLNFRITLAARSNAPAGIATATVIGRAAGVPFQGGHWDTLPVIVSANTAQIAVNLAPVATLYGIGNDRLVLGDNGGIDGGGFAYSGVLLGPGLTWGANQFVFGRPADGEPRGYNAVAGVAIPLPAGHCASLKMLASAHGGQRTDQVFTVTYTDGTSTTFTQSLSDWTAPQRFPGETIVATNAYCDLHVGTFHSTRYLYGYAFPLDRGRIVKEFQMPGASPQSGKGGVVALAFTLDWDENTPPDFALSASPRSLSFGQRSTVATVISVNALNNFAGDVSLSASGLPDTVTASFTPVMGSSTLKLTTSDSVATGRFTLMVTGVSGGMKRSIALNFE